MPFIYSCYGSSTLRQLSSITCRRSVKNIALHYCPGQRGEIDTMPCLQHDSQCRLVQIRQPVSESLTYQQRSGLTKVHHRFCDEHRQITHEDEEAWKLHRDITHALILPVIGLYQHASRLAMSLLGTDDNVDLELLFRGEARGAFAWLQCFIMDEEEWCSARDCPGDSRVRLDMSDRQVNWKISMQCQCHSGCRAYHPYGPGIMPTVSLSSAATRRL